LWYNSKKKEVTVLEKDGKMYARVSDIIVPFNDFSKISKEVLEKKAALGTEVHGMIADYVEQRFCIGSMKATEYFNSFLRWHDIVKPKFIQSEQRYWSDDLRLTGAIDAIVHIPGDKMPTLIDYKTSSLESPTTWPMQAHMYRMLLNEAGIYIADRFLFIKLSKDGLDPAVFDYRYSRTIDARCREEIRKFWEKVDQKDHNDG
jgi:hypothetical protein